MAYWVHRILLKTGKLVAENTLPADANLFDGPTPNVGDRLLVTCRGKKVTARVVDVRRSTAGKPDYIRAQEVSADDDGHSVRPMLPFWGYYVSQLRLKQGNLVPTEELPQEPYHAPTPEAGDEVVVNWRGKPLNARVTGVQSADPTSTDQKDHIQVDEL